MPQLWSYRADCNIWVKYDYDASTVTSTRTYEANILSFFIYPLLEDLEIKKIALWFSIIISIYQDRKYLYLWFICQIEPQIAGLMGPTWGPPGSCRPQMGPMLGIYWLMWRGAVKHADALSGSFVAASVKHFSFTYIFKCQMTCDTNSAHEALSGAKFSFHLRGVSRFHSLMIMTLISSCPIWCVCFLLKTSHVNMI